MRNKNPKFGKFYFINSLFLGTRVREERATRLERLAGALQTTFEIG